MRRNPADLEILYLPEELKGVLAVADRRVSLMLRHWVLRGDYDLGFLLRSVYLQGVKDGAQVAEGVLNKQ